MKKIGIDARLYSQTGVGVYIRNLLFYLQRIEKKDINFYIYLSEDDFKRVNFINKNFIKRKADFHWHSLDEQTRFLRLLNQDNLDLMHFTYFSYPLLYQKKFISTIHDLTPLLFKTGKASTKNPLIYNFKHLVFKLVLSSQIKKAAAIITPSETVKKQIIKYYGSQYQNKIYPTYEGVNWEIIQAKENRNLNKKFNKPFFIYVGNFYPHKNIERLVEAFSQIKEDIFLVLVGPDDFFSKRLKQDKRIIMYHNSSSADLVFFYKNARALIHPSLAEGFGLPLIEAVYFNLPVIASDISVFQEILTNHYLSFNPYSVDDIRKKIAFFIKKKPTFDYGQILTRYSFKEMAERTLGSYRKIISTI